MEEEISRLARQIYHLQESLEVVVSAMGKLAEEVSELKKVQEADLRFRMELQEKKG